MGKLFQWQTKKQKKMKKISIIGALSLSLVAGLTTTSCEDMLTLETGDKIYTSANDTLYSYWGIMKAVQGIAERSVILGECRGDLVTSTKYTSDSINNIANFNNPQDGDCRYLEIRDYYTIINNCNCYIANADTNQIKNNVKYMLPEYAQVQAIRAWTYLQLVQNYGEVPFISEPITSLDVIKNFDYEGNLVNKDNLLDRILELGLTRYITTAYPIYDKYQTGAVDVTAKMLYFPVRLILADLYLMRGRDKNDYRQAAQYYYDYLKNTSSTVPLSYCTAMQSSMSSTGYVYSSYSWGTFASEYTNSALNDVITTIPSAANRQFGTMLTGVSDIFGFETTSSQSTNVTEGEDGDEVSTSGSISTTINPEVQELAPSLAYKGLNEVQNYVYYNSDDKRTDYDCGDARMQSSILEYNHEDEGYSFCTKANSNMSGSFYYAIPVYRKTVVWLRLAEAINRAGFPQCAFAILKDGLNSNNWPELVTKKVLVNRVDENGDYVYDEETGEIIKDTVYQRAMEYAANGACYYIDSVEYKSFFLNFTDDVWESNYGIHARGCGIGNPTTANFYKTNITGYSDSTVYTYDSLLIKQGVDPKIASEDEIINAVENLIVDELALEAAFEGYRFPDLVRFANHKNASNINGTEWLADKIARRNMKVDADGVVTGERDENLYTKLLDQKNWYLNKPEWTD